MVDNPGKLVGSDVGITPQGVGYEIHYNVEQNSKGFNKKVSVGLFYGGSGDVDHDKEVLRSAALMANDLGFQGQIRLENKMRRQMGMDILHPADGRVLGTNVPEPTDWEEF